MNRYLQLFRAGNALMGIVGVTVASFMATGMGMADRWPNMILTAVVVFMFISGGNAVNDYVDHEIDKTAHPERPIPSGRIERRTALKAGAGMLAASVAVSLLMFDPVVAVIVAIAAVLMASYELGLKQRGFVGNLTIAVLTGMMFLLGGAAVGDCAANAVVAAMACLVSVGREIAKDIEDMDSDVGRTTLPMKIGTRNASAVACAFFVAGPVLSVLPLAWHTYGVLFYTVIVADALFLYCAATVFRDRHKAQKTAKIAMAVALVSFVLGVLPV